MPKSVANVLLVVAASFYAALCYVALTLDAPQAVMIERFAVVMVVFSAIGIALNVFARKADQGRTP